MDAQKEIEKFCVQSEHLAKEVEDLSNQMYKAQNKARRRWGVGQCDCRTPGPGGGVNNAFRSDHTIQGEMPKGQREVRTTAN